MYLYGSFLTEDLLVDVIEKEKKHGKLHVYAYCNKYSARR